MKNKSVVEQTTDLSFDIRYNLVSLAHFQIPFLILWIFCVDNIIEHCA